MTIGFIGAGKVGVTLGKYFKEKGLEVKGFYSKSPQSAKWAAQFTNSANYESLQDIINNCDMLMFTVPDGQIAEVWEEAKFQIINQSVEKKTASHKMICHCSGLHSSKIFSEIEGTNCAGYSIHPLCAINDKETSWQYMNDVLFTIEGHDAYMKEIQQMFQLLENQTQVLDASKKAVYHAAASLASNHLVGVFSMAVDTFLQCGFSEEEATKQLYHLAAGNLEQIREKGCVDALTGPIERGDVDTVQRHIRVLSELSDKIQQAYVANANVLVDLSERKHPKRNYGEMKQMLTKSETFKSQVKI